MGRALARGSVIQTRLKARYSLLQSNFPLCSSLVPTLLPNFRSSCIIGGGGGGAHPLLPLIAAKSLKRQRHSAATAAFNHISKSKPQMMYVASQVVYKLGHSGHFRHIFKSLRPTCANLPNLNLGGPFNFRENLFFANISKSKPQMMYVASQVVYKLGHSGHF